MYAWKTRETLRHRSSSLDLKKTCQTSRTGWKLLFVNLTVNVFSYTF